jgi:hypothetical protein
MIRCVDSTELEKFVRGALDPDRMLVVDEHLAECADCRASVARLPAFRAVAWDLGALLVEVADCPEYDELSAFVDGKLSQGHAREISIHANACELCASDIERIRELRSQAALRGTVTVIPGASARRSGCGVGFWKRVAAGAVVVGVMVGIVLSLNTIGRDPVPEQPTVAVKSGGDSEIATNQKPILAPPGPSKDTEGAPAGRSRIAPVTPTPKRPAPATVAAKPLLRDGNYQVVRKDNEMVLARIDGKSIRTPLEARVMASIEEKLRTGKVKLREPVRVAMNTTLRADEGYTPPQTAPSPVSPSGKVLLTDRPTLAWSKVELAESYRIVVTSADGDVVFDRSTDQNRISLDVPLARGHEYRWRVGVRFGKDDAWTNSKAASFVVLSDGGVDAIRNVKSAMPGSHLALGVVYESLGLYDEAAAEYGALVKSNPHSSLAKDMLRKTAGGTR